MRLCSEEEGCSCESVFGGQHKEMGFHAVVSSSQNHWLVTIANNYRTASGNVLCDQGWSWGERAWWCPGPAKGMNRLLNRHQHR